MTVLWVILDDDKASVVEVFETKENDAVAHWGKFLQHKQGNSFCRRPTSLANKVWGSNKKFTWYVNYFYWKDTTRWGIGEPTGIAWSICLAIPEALKMLEFVE